MIQGKAPFLSDFEMTQIPDNATQEEIISLANKAFKHLSFINKALSFQANFNGYIAENVKIPASSTVKIEHYLGVSPKNRIIFRQTGNGVITDVNGPLNWNEKVISLKNNGAEEVVLNVFISRE